MAERLYKAIEIEKASAIYDLYYQDELKESDTDKFITVDVRTERVNLNELYLQIKGIEGQIAVAQEGIVKSQEEQAKIQQRINEILKIAS